ncbi:MAG: hypothetical protein JXB24_09375 [Bacteroidales bacterium]|nr:hypothetical protein [Bacteroidales bacterium]
MNIFLKLYNYQKTKFPVIILFFTTLSSVASSAAVLNYQVKITQVILAFFAIIFLLFHIRVLDDSRDFENDAICTPDSPLHNGTISLRQLIFPDILGLVFVLLTSLYSGCAAVILMIAVLTFSFFTWKDFFIRKNLLKNKIVYHLINSPLMIMLQLYIFTLYTGELYLNKTMWILVLFVYNNIFILELIRKISPDPEEKNYENTYSASMGFKKSVLFSYLLAILSFVIFLILIYRITGEIILYALYALPLLVLLSYGYIKFIISRSSRTGKIYLLAILLEYIFLNGLICIAAI